MAQIDGGIYRKSFARQRVHFIPGRGYRKSLASNFTYLLVLNSADVKLKHALPFMTGRLHPPSPPPPNHTLYFLLSFLLPFFTSIIQNRFGFLSPSHTASRKRSLKYLKRLLAIDRGFHAPISFSLSSLVLRPLVRPRRCMNRMAKICARYLGGHRGFSIGIEDVTPGTQVSDERNMRDSDSVLVPHLVPIPDSRSRPRFRCGGDASVPTAIATCVLRDSLSQCILSFYPLFGTHHLESPSLRNSNNKK